MVKAESAGSENPNIPKDQSEVTLLLQHKSLQFRCCTPLVRRKWSTFDDTLSWPSTSLDGLAIPPGCPSETRSFCSPGVAHPLEIYGTAPERASETDICFTESVGYFYLTAPSWAPKPSS